MSSAESGMLPRVVHDQRVIEKAQFLGGFDREARALSQGDGGCCK